MVLLNARNDISEIKSAIMCLMYPVHSVVYKNHIDGPSFYANSKVQNFFKGMSIENSIVRPNFVYTHGLKNYPNLLKILSLRRVTK